MSEVNRDCIFRQLDEIQLEKDQDGLSEKLANVLLPAVDVLLALPKNEPETDEGLEEQLTALEAPVCGVEECRLSALALLQNTLGFGNVTPRQEIAEMVAPSCTRLDDVSSD